MPKGLKQTSQQIVISFDASQTNPNDVVSERIDLQLNALDNEVFVITGCKLDVSPPDFTISGTPGVTSRFRCQASLSKQDISASALGTGLGNPSVFASQDIEIHTAVNGTAPESLAAGVSTVASDHTDAPFEVEYLDIIATPDFYINFRSVNQTNAQGVEGKLYGYRARADASIYASLVQSELLSQ